ncbi:hypothetical protein, partial [Bryobacter aggregatus]|uniref:hypothetical protein n=1 Tax=Bryobacter aggregatus TaxID=360054 RepID=UPI0004E1CD08
MAKKADFNAEEWDQLRELPSIAGLMVVAASPSGPIGLVQESSAAATRTHKVLDHAQTELLQALAEDLKGSLHMPRLEAQTSDEIRSRGLAACRAVATILRKVSPEEAEEYKGWVMELAHGVAEAAKEGGFLGFGGTPVTPEESVAIDQIAVALR